MATAGGIGASFAAQFADEAGRLVYRHNGIGPALPVTPAEREAFVAAFADATRGWYRRIIVAVAAGEVAVAVAALAVHLGTGALTAANLVVIAGVVGWSLAIVRRAAAVPNAALGGRSPVAPALDRDAARRMGLARLGWPALLGVAAYAGFVAWRFDVIDDPLAARQIGWTAMAAGLVVLTAVQAWRKWRVEHGC